MTPPSAVQDTAPEQLGSIKLRDYQLEATDAVFEQWGAGIRRPAIVLPTGAGKTVVFAHVASRFRTSATPGLTRVVILVHRDELVRQAVAKLRAVAPHLAVGVVKADENDVDADVIVASVATLHRPARLSQLRDVGLVIVDECHHALATSYMSILTYFGCFAPSSTPGALALGVTATLERGDGGRLGLVWQKIANQKDIVWMIRRGWLADVEGVAVSLDGLDLSQVATTKGDYQEGALALAMEQALAPEIIARKYGELARRADGTIRPGIAFWPSVAMAQEAGEEFSKRGIRTAAIWGAMPEVERAYALRSFELGKIDVLSNCMVLTEGFDSPRAEVCVLGRPTASSPLYVQMVGRVLRPYPGKAKALVLDVVGAAGRHQLATLATLAGALPKAPKDGQSLLEAMEEFEAAAVEQLVSGYAHGPVVVEAIDLFGGSRQQWLRTHAGHWFIPAGDRLIVLHEAREPGCYDVAWWPTKGKGGGWIARSVPDLGYAMARGEADISADEDALSRKAGRWRTRRPSPAQLDLLGGLTGKRPMTPEQAHAAGLKMGDVGDLISIEKASLRLDPVIAKLMRAYGVQARDPKASS